MADIVHLIVLYMLVQVNIAEKLVTMDVTLKMTGLNKVYPQPVAKVKADGQSMYALVDTGAPYMFFVWKYWYENKQENCDALIFGCYECTPPCKRGPTKVVDFVDGKKIQIFQHTGELGFSDGVSAPLDFGLVTGFNRKPARIWASLGLGASNSETYPYRPVVEQLLAKKVITQNSYSIYFTTGDESSGELILGGDDPSKHVGPLNYLKIADVESELVQVLGLTIGSDPKDTIDMAMPAVLDTGASHILMNLKFKSQVVAFLETAGTKKVQIQEQGVNFVISCNDASNLPSITFLMEGLDGEKIPLVISAGSLVWKFQGDICFVRIAFVDYEDAIFLGVSAFLGHYYYFDHGNNKIGFANLK